MYLLDQYEDSEKQANFYLGKLKKQWMNDEKFVPFSDK